VTEFCAVFGASVAFIFLKAFQQLNVVHSKYWLVLPTSMGMALFEVTVVYNIAHHGLWVFVPCGLGGGLGCLGSMYIHKKMRNSPTRR
jgi:hypothetical protein